MEEKTLKQLAEEARLENGLVPLSFRPTAALDAWNGGVSNIYFDSNQTYQEVPVETAVVLQERYPKNFVVGVTVRKSPAVAAEVIEASVETVPDDPDVQTVEVGYSDLEGLPFNRLRKMAAELAREGDVVPRRKVEVIEFILERQ